jgi:hypothetical protein
MFVASSTVDVPCFKMKFVKVLGALITGQFWLTLIKGAFENSNVH